MVDIHTHIINEIDDGASSLEESLALCRMAYENNITDIILTPHMMMLDNIDSFLEERDSKINILKENLEKQEIPIRLYPGAEVYADEDIMFCDELFRLTLNHSRYLLIEFAFDGISIRRVMRYISYVVDAGLIPIIAHPERYIFFQDNHPAIYGVLEYGGLLQVNATSLAGYGGRKEKKLASNLVNSGLADFIASDAHSTRIRTTELLKMLMYSKLQVSADRLQEIMDENPKRVIQDEDLPKRDFLMPF